MYHVHRVEVVEPFEDLDDVARDESFGQVAERLEGLLQRTILDEPMERDRKYAPSDQD